jgi:hypothetical protein
MPFGLKVGIVVAIIIGFLVGFVGPDHRVLSAMGFATTCGSVGCRHGDPLRTLVVLGAAVATFAFLAIRPTLIKFLAALVVITIGVGFFTYTKPGARMLKSLRPTTACASSNGC